MLNFLHKLQAQLQVLQVHARFHFQLLTTLCHTPMRNALMCSPHAPMCHGTTSGTPGTRQISLPAPNSPSCATLCHTPMCNAPMCSLHAPMCHAPPVLLMHTPPDSIQLKQVCIRTTPRHTARVLYPVCPASVFRGAFKLPSNKSKATSPDSKPPQTRLGGFSLA